MALSVLIVIMAVFYFVSVVIECHKLFKTGKHKDIALVCLLLVSVCTMLAFVMSVVIYRTCNPGGFEW